ncbi:hypothetical protein [Argonema galeatum]|uniref:hypothetical protein n=1 Tax=Argonema galeatum TaxID=2942762 RepID=UPI002010DCB3|nr:hypothetical protein [Argonema galeatum]MCL1466040.1 hypothetical protein [Argonema galeatum A003/A1]
MRAEEIALYLALICNAIQLVSWWNTSQRKRYASELDFVSIKEGQRTILEQVKHLEKQIESHEIQAYRRAKDIESHLIDELKEVKAITNALIVKMTGDSISDILRKKDDI